jgi:hypothetical protein
MPEKDFWLTLEYRVSREFPDLQDDRARSLWCDGFIPEQTDLQATRPCIHGHAWIGEIGSSDQEQWSFTLFVGQHRSEDEINWAALLPDDNMTGWLDPDPKTKTLTIDPLSARPK